MKSANSRLEGCRDAQEPELQFVGGTHIWLSASGWICEQSHCAGQSAVERHAWLQT